MLNAFYSVFPTIFDSILELLEPISSSVGFFTLVLDVLFFSKTSLCNYFSFLCNLAIALAYWSNLEMSSDLL